MKVSKHRQPKWILLLSSCAAFFFFVGVNQLAQTKMQMPARTGRVNDFAGVVDEKTRQQLENILENLKQKTGIEFDIATVESTAGQDIFDFSRQLALDWGIGARTSAKESLLLVVSVNDKTSFTQFSKSVQNELPEGVLGEMSQRMRAPVNAGQFSEALSVGVDHFVSSMAKKLAFSTDDFDKTPSTVSIAKPSTAENSIKPSEQPGTAITSPSSTGSSRSTVRTSVARDESASIKTKRPGAKVDDEAESEEVELTLTLPLEDRVVKLRGFIDAHPDSKSKSRATELLVSAHAGLGDERLKKGDSGGGIEELMLAIAEAPASSSEKLFAGVISQIPLNLYLRGERDAAAKAAQNIEAKFGDNPKRLLAVSGFYLGIEQGSEASRVAAKAVQLAPEMAEAHQALGLALHISLRLDEAAGEYKRALELDPNSKGTRRSLADLNRAFGKSEEAIALYRQQLIAEPTDKAARAGLVLSLLDLGRTDEAKSELESALKADPRNLPLLTGAAYWFAAHNDSEAALALADKAVEIEPRYTWSQITLARALVGQKRPLEAERALRFARQYGKFPTLDYELASTLAATGLYDEASEILMQSFSLKDNQIEARLAGRASARSSNFIDLLAPERRATIFQSVAADTENNAKILKALLTFATFINQEDVGKIDEQAAIAAAREFASGDDDARVHRQLYVASRLLQKGIGFQTVYELAEAARSSIDAGLAVPAVTVAVQADEYREIRARAIASGGTPDIPEAPRNILSNLLRGKIEDFSGWALFNQDKLDEAVEHLKRAVNILPEGTPASRTSLWHLGAALDRQDKKEEALAYYIKSYNAGEPDPVRRTVIEQLYRKVNGSLAGLDERIGAFPAMAMNAQTPARDDTTSVPAQPTSSPESTPTTSEISATPESTPIATPIISATPVTEASPTSAPEAPVVSTPQVTPSPETPPEQAPQSSATPAPEPPAATPQAAPSPETLPLPEPQSPPTPAPETPAATPQATPSPETLPLPEPQSPPTPAPETPAATPQAAPSPETPPEQAPQSSATPVPEPPAATPQATPSPETPPEQAPQPSPTASPETTPTPGPTPVPESSAVTTPTPESPVERMIPKPPATVTITGRVKDSSNNPIANVVVVLISPQGTVLASTTNEEGKYSFTVVPSAHSYRIIPSKDGFTFEPVDKVLPDVNDDQKELDFVGTMTRKP